MTDERFDRMVRAADPYPEIADRLAGHLAGAEQHLLEEIMSDSQPRPGLLRRSAFMLAAAAVLITVVAVSLAFRGQTAQPSAIVPPAAAPEQRQPPAMTPAAWQRLAEESPRLLIDEDGWKVTTAYGFADSTGTIGFTQGKRTLEMNWYPATQYQSYREDRDEVSKPEPATVDGWKGRTVTYSDSDFAVMLEPRDGVFVELRGGVGNRKAFDTLLTHVKRVDVKTWLAALPPEIVTPDKAQAAAAEVLADIPQPPGFDVKKIKFEGANDPYQFGARVTSEIGCRWIAEWDRAKKAGDTTAMNRAADAMKSSHRWKVLNDMNAEGDWPEVFWQYSDQLAAGVFPKGYRSGIGCDTTW